MTKAQIQDWLTYWTQSRMVSTEEIQSLQDVATARKFCSCMNVGPFLYVNDDEIWAALREMGA